MVLLVMMVAFVKDLHSDPMFIRRAYARNAVENAVEHAEEGRGAGSDFDSAAERYTEWYQRTDEDGENVEYDFETGEGADGYKDSE